MKFIILVLLVYVFETARELTYVASIIFRMCMISVIWYSDSEENFKALRRNTLEAI